MTVRKQQEVKTIKVAIIGTGLAGLSSAYLLEKSNIIHSASKDSPVNFEVHLFEKNASIGMDASSITVATTGDQDIRYYSHLVKLYNHLGVISKPARFSFGWYRIHGFLPKDLASENVANYTQNTSYLCYSGSRTIGVIDSPQNVDAAAQWWLFYKIWHSIWVVAIVGISYLRLMLFCLWYNYRGHFSNTSHPVTRLTLGQWFNYAKIHPYFAHEVFIPLFAAVCTNRWQSMLNYPASDVLQYMAKGLFQESYVVTHGVREVVRRLVAPVSKKHIGIHIQKIRPSSDSNFLYALEDDKGQIYKCHHVIFATQANQARKILETSSQGDAFLDGLLAQISSLKKFKYETSLVINHTDIRLLPSDKRHWRTLNLAQIDATVDPNPRNDCQFIVPTPHDTTMTTHIINWTNSKLSNQQPSPAIFLQTTNPCISPDPKKILSVSWFERATVTLESQKAIKEDLFPMKQNKISPGPCQGGNNIWFVGSYCWYGIPLLEGCVASSEQVVVNGIGAHENVEIKVPW
ncbi:hypothetical protein DM01DRAFT_1329083 [Hesseltinella vesiculosa]|uniref:FAD/NAD(P)-binding domain-containing protein n=1 Tax=Hesseltinella vesiculosa TaxID=101127 RepID=A0A1X2G438_9FUNG|nr:hypothetical protein DM01DRAFT_1329083 [Hesseltinella vesiculosa]